MAMKESDEAIRKAANDSKCCCVVELCKAHLQTHPQDGMIWIRYAMALAKLCRYMEADNAFDSAWEFSHDSAREVIVAERGHMHRRKGDYQKAEQYYRMFIGLCPHDAAGYVFLGVLVFRRGDLLQAESILREGIACGGESVDEAYFNLGSVLSAQERYREALDCYQKALEIDPEYKVAKSRLRDVKKVTQLRTSL